ncbi:hypothetical protein Gotri_012396, partial [Gossypium trilobum]|nr:hypothetical protein [Gossypium trilobum]
SYLCILEFKGDRILCLVEESRLCDLSVINGAVIHCWSTLTAEDRSQLALSSWAAQRRQDSKSG